MMESYVFEFIEMWFTGYIQKPSYISNFRDIITIHKCSNYIPNYENVSKWVSDSYLTHKCSKGSLQSQHINKTLTSRRILCHSEIKCPNSRAISRLLLLHNNDHQLHTFGLHKPLLVLQRHQQAAQTIKQVLHHFLLIQTLRILRLVHRHGLKHHIHAVHLPYPPLIRRTILQQNRQNLRRVLLVTIKLPHLYLP